MVAERGIITACYLLHFGQAVPGHGREVMMFIMITYVQVRDIQRSVIALGFLVAMSEKMFLDPAGAERVKTDGKEKADQQVNGGFCPRKYMMAAIKTICTSQFTIVHPSNNLISFNRKGRIIWKIG